MDTKRLQELAGVQLNEELKPTNGKEFTQKDWDEHIGHIVDIILHMAKADAEGPNSNSYDLEIKDNAETYMEDAFHDIKATIKQRVGK